MKKYYSFLICAVSLLAFTGQVRGQLIINTIAGDGTAAYGGDLGAATSAKLNTPYGVAVDAIGNVYVADCINNRIRKIDTFGIIRTIAGTGVAGYGGDGAAATAALLYAPRGICVDVTGNVYFSDYVNHRVRKISTLGIITTVAGTGVGAYGGDGGPATAAQLKYAWGVAIDGGGNLYIADQFNCRVRKVDAAGIITSIAGTGICAPSTDGGPASSAIVQYPVGVACDAVGNIYVDDYGNNRIRKINTAGIISTIAGSSVYGFSGDGGPSTASQLYYPMGIAVDGPGNVYICDVNNDRIRMINTAGTITTIIGNGSAGYSGDGGAPASAQINRSTGVAVDALGNVYVADNSNNRIRKTYIATHAPFFTHGHSQDISFCPTETLNLDSMLKIFDVDTGQTETWSLILPPAHGAATVSYLSLSTGSAIQPSGLVYSATAGYVGADSFMVRITDGTYADTTTIHITILPPPNAGAITGIDSLCPGEYITFTGSEPGGIWNSSNTAIAGVSAIGLVTGVAPGTAYISYTVTNICGSATASVPLLVRANCPVKVNAITSSADRLVIYPNPNTGLVTISLSTAAHMKIHFVITNTVGEKVSEFSGDTNKAIAVKLGLPQGIYFISATTICGTVTGKMSILNGSNE